MTTSRDVVLFLDTSVTGNGLQFFETAKAIGVTPMLVAKRPTEHAELSHFQNMPVRRMSVEDIVKAIDDFGRDRIAGVCSALSQRAEMVALVAKAIGRPHCDEAVVAVCRDKFRTREVLADAGFRDVLFERAWTGEEAAEGARKIGGTVIIKPRESSGATGVRICRSPEEARDHVESLATTMPQTRDIGVVVEEYIEGPQFGIEMFDLQTIAVRRKHISPPPASIPIGMDNPPLDDPQVCARIAAHAEKALQAVGYTRGPAHVEVRLGAKGPCLIEINPRLVGGVGAENVRRAYGVDMIEATIRLACGLPYDLSRKKERASVTRYLLRDGEAVSEVLGREDALAVPGIVEVGFFPDGFSRTGGARNYEDRIGYILSECDTPAEAIAAADEALRRLRPVAESGWKTGLRRLLSR